jgi:hypothetical protein
MSQDKPKRKPNFFDYLIDTLDWISYIDVFDHPIIFILVPVVMFILYFSAEITAILTTLFKL